MTHCGPIIGTNAGLDVIDCHACGYAHLAQLPDAAERENYYQKHYYDNAEGLNLFLKETLEHKRGLWNAAYADQLALLRNRSTILDVGCGAGWFIGYCWYHNWPAYGIEPSIRARNHSQSASRIYATYADARCAGALLLPTHLRLSFVLEHILDPGAFLTEYLPQLYDQRLLVIVPNDFSPLQKKLGTKHFIGHDHINYFTPYSLRCLFEKHGLRVVGESATFPMELFALAGIHYIGNQDLGRRCHMQRLRFEQYFGRRAFQLYRLLYHKLGWSREIVLVAEQVHVNKN